MIPAPGYIPAAIGFVVIGTGMGPVYPAIQHMAPTNFGEWYSAAVIECAGFNKSSDMFESFGRVSAGDVIDTMMPFVKLHDIMISLCPFT